MANRDLIGRTLGEYVLHEPVGQGGGGFVYRSRQPTLNRDLIVKVMRKRMLDNSNARERFLREAQLASRLQHHYATHIYAFGVEPDGLRWIAMELVHGVTFDAWLRAHGPMSLEQLVPLLERIAEVVQAAHDLGIVHRDIKPSNIMVAEDHAGTLVPKLLDFGIAKADFDVISPEPERWADGSLGADKVVRDAEPITRTDPEAMACGFTPPGVGLGSLPYMSPEQQCDSASVGPAADIYSLAVVAYQALHGHLPPPPAPRPRGEVEVSAVLDRIFARALARLPGDRHPTALALAAEFRAALQASEREQLRASARQWQAGGRAPGLLWGRDMLDRFERWTRTSSWRALDPGELAFVAQSQLRARRSAWSGRLLVGLAVALVVGTLGGWQRYTSMEARLAEEQVTQLEVEQGRQALRDNAAEAKVHLANAYRRGDHSPGTTFMLARALESDRVQLARLPARGGHNWSARFSPDGQTIVTTDNESAQLWDARTYQHWLDLPHPGIVYDAVFSHDGKLLYTACDDGIVRVWSAETGVVVRALRAADAPQSQYHLVLSNDESMLASGDLDATMAIVWNLRNGEPLATLKLDGHRFPGLGFTTDDRWFAVTGGEDVAVFDTQTWRRVLSLPGARRLSVDPTSARIATGSPEGDVVIWSVPDGAELRRFHASGDPIDRVMYSPDDNSLAALEEGQLQIWDLATGRARMRLPTRASRAAWLEFSRDSRRVVATFSDGAVLVVDPDRGVAQSLLSSSDGTIRSAHFAPDGGRVLAAVRNGSATVWSTDSYFRWTVRSQGSACRNDVPTEQRFLLLACPGSPTRVWDVELGRLVAELPSTTDLAGRWHSMHAAVSSLGTRAAVARGSELDIYELPSAHLLHTVHHPADINVVAFSTDGRDLITADIQGTMLLSQGDAAPVSLPRATAGIDAVGILPERIIATSADRQIFIYDRTTLALVAQRSMLTRVEAVRFSSDGARMATMPEFSNAGRGAPEVWDLNRARLVARLVDLPMPLNSVWFPGKSHDLLTTDGATVRKWDADSGLLQNTYSGGSVLLADATTTPDGAAVVALGLDGVLRFWDVKTARPLWSLATLRGPVLELRRHGPELLNIGFDGQISGWRLLDATSTVEQVLGAAVSCRDETRSWDPKTCHSP